MNSRPGFLTLLFFVTMFALSGCASVEKPEPVDPVKEQITILQKQLLELQNAQNETRRKLDEQRSAVEALSTKLSSLEEKTAAPVVPPSQIESKPTATAQMEQRKKPAPAKKKPVKKKKKQLRRAEQ